MKTIYFAATSLDGYIADKNNSLDWLFQFGPPEEGLIENFIETVGSIAMGSTTYEWLLENNKGPWPYKGPRRRSQSLFIFTTRDLRAVPDANIKFVRGDVVPVHKELVKEAGGKNVWIVGGGELVGKFYDAHLLNEIQIRVVSVTLAGGAPLFPRYTVKPLLLVSAKQQGSAGVDLTYNIEY